MNLWGKAITVRSESGNPSSCVIDCGGTSSSWHTGFFLGNSETFQTILEGFTIQGCYGGSGSAVNCNGSSPTIANCVFSADSSDGPGGAVDLLDSDPTFTDCVFTTNYSTSYGGAVLCTNSSPDFYYCSFISNEAAFAGGAMWGYGGVPEFTGCTFIANRSLWGGGFDLQEGCSPVFLDCSFFSNVASFGGGAIRTGGAHPILINCTLAADSSGFGGAGIHCGSDDSPTLEATVIAFGQVGMALYCEVPPGDPSVTCCIMYGNDGGDWVDCISGMDAINDNMHLDPKFCDLAGLSPNVEDCSPCLGSNNTCSIDIGSGVSGCACGASTEPATWGRIKAEFMK